MEFKKAEFPVLVGGELEDRQGYTFELEGIEVFVCRDGAIWSAIDMGAGRAVASGNTRRETAERVARLNDAYLEFRSGERYGGLCEEYGRLLWEKLLDENAGERDMGAITFESVAEWANGKDLRVVQLDGGSSPEKNPIWVLGLSREYRDELAEMGFKWGRSRKLGKGWHYDFTA